MRGVPAGGRLPLYVAIDAPPTPTTLHLVATDVATGRRVLTLPIRIRGGTQEADHAAQ